MAAQYGSYPWQPTGNYQWMLSDVIEVIESYRQYWPLTQRSWLYRLMSQKKWQKSWEAHDPDVVTKRENAGKPLNKTSGGGLNLILDRGRRAGLIPWEAVQSKRGSHIEPYRMRSADDFATNLQEMLGGMTVDRQMNQERRVIVCCETDGMVPILESVCLEYGVDLISGQGFSTIGAKRDMATAIGSGDSIILHLADHDHSGREIERALQGDISAWVTELGGKVEVKNIALTDKQIDEYELYWEAAKDTGSNHGLGSGITRWAQLEAFDPDDLLPMLRYSIEGNLDMNAYREALMLESQWKGPVTKGLTESISGRF